MIRLFMNIRTYSLFVKEKGKYVRLSALACSLKSARSLFQGALIGGSMSGHAMYLRPALDDWNNKDKYDAERNRIFPPVSMI